MVLTAFVVLACPIFSMYNSVCTESVSACHLNDFDNSWQVLSCVAGTVLWNNKCVQTCTTAGFYQYGDSCVACPSNCATCTDTNNCTSCSTGYKFNTYLKCEKICPSGYYFDEAQCVACDSTCKTCIQSGSLYCSTCYPSATLRLNAATHGQCIPKLPVGFTNYYRQDPSDTYVLQCPSTCATCTDYHNCTACIAGFALQVASGYARCI